MTTTTPLFVFVLSIACSVIAPAAGHAQSPSRDRAAATVRVPLIADHIDLLGGQRVRVVQASVSRVHDRNVFTIRPTRRVIGFRARPGEIVVLVPQGQALVPEGQSVEVLGLARTFYGAELSGDVPWLAGLDPRVRDRIRGLPVVVAASVRTPDGVELLRGNGNPDR